MKAECRRMNKLHNNFKLLKPELRHLEIVPVRGKRKDVKAQRRREGILHSLLCASASLRLCVKSGTSPDKQGQGKSGQVRPSQTLDFFRSENEHDGKKVWLRPVKPSQGMSFFEINFSAETGRARLRLRCAAERGTDGAARCTAIRLRNWQLIDYELYVQSKYFAYLQWGCKTHLP